MKKLLIFLLILGLTLSLFHTYFRVGFPYTNDGENHLARFANYKIALKEGQIPPRFAPNLMNHYGYPVFNYNYPLANILSLPFSLIKLNPETSFKLISVFAYVGGLLGMYSLLHIQRKSLFTVVMAMILFGLNPYILNVVLYRGSIGELLAISFFPWLLWTIEFILKNKSFSIFCVLVWTGFLLSHNVTVVLFLGFLLPYITIKYWKQWNAAAQFLMMAGLSILLTSWFWLPALLEANQVVVKEAGIANQLFDHFVSISQLLFGQLGFGFSNPGPIDSLSFQLGYPHVLVLILSIVVVLKLLYNKIHIEKTSLYILFMATLLIFLELSISVPIWQLIPALKIIQFSWRLSILLVIIVPLLWAEYSSYYTQNARKILLVTTFAYCFLISHLRPVDFFHRNSIDYDVFSQSTSTQNENRTKEFTYINVGDWQPKPSIIGAGTAVVEHWTGSDRKYSLDLTADSVIIEPTMNFIGWQTTVLDTSNHTVNTSYLQDDTIAGRLAYTLPKGTYHVTSRFTQHTPARILGNTLFILGAGIIFLIGFQRFRLHRNIHDKKI